MITIKELVDRDVIRDDLSYVWLNKMTDEEILEMDNEFIKQLDEENVSKFFPERNAAMLAKYIDRNILYQLLIDAYKNTL